MSGEEGRTSHTMENPLFSDRKKIFVITIIMITIMIITVIITIIIFIRKTSNISDFCLNIQNFSNFSF